MSATVTTVKCEIVDESDEPYVLAYTADKDAALNAARNHFARNHMNVDSLTAGEPRLWRWIPCDHGDYSRMLHPWDKPGRGAFVAIEVRDGGPR